ncbi:4-oxalocrotonate tautomerase family protein [Ensifer sp. IC3342]|nr:4-oxalocrotonate tautomerase family protein [Ensifer sp. BRP08]MCA1450948.1 4-oxalocrotonate tautomerase family protein [Ensifer sp. IC3342]
MPFVEVKVFKDELSSDQTRALIEKITDVVASVTSEKLKEVTWVIVSEVPSGHWGVGGVALGLDDVKKLVMAPVHHLGTDMQ